MWTFFEHVFQIWESIEVRALQVSKIKARYVHHLSMLSEDSRQLLDLVRTFQCAKNITTMPDFPLNCIDSIIHKVGVFTASNGLCIISSNIIFSLGSACSIRMDCWSKFKIFDILIH